MRFEATIRAFAAALAEPSAAPPAMTRGRLGAPDARRFSVYRNNVAVGLIGALEARYPVARRIAGDDAFRALARAYIRAKKPRSPVMIAYGEDFPEFVASCEGVGALPRRPGAARERLGRGLPRRGRAGSDDRRPCRIEPRSPARNPDRVSPCRALLRFSTPAASIWASAQSRRRPRRAEPTGSAKTRSSPVPTPTSGCASCRLSATISPCACGRAQR